MSKFNGARLAAFIVVSMATTGTALAQQTPDQNQQNQPYPQNQPYQQNQPTTTEDQTTSQPQTQAQAPAQQPAQAPTTVIVNPPPSTQAPANYESEPGSMSSMQNVGFSLSAGGGVGQFTSHELRDTTGTAGTWAVRATIGTKSPIGFEGSYIGSAQSITALGLDSSAVLVGNGVQGALRLNAAIGAPVTPFLFGGVAWTHYSLTNKSFNTSDVSNSDNVLEIPVGLGIGGSYAGFGYDVRGEMRFATNADMIPAVSAGRDTGSSADMHRWGVNATIGYGF
jgi:hypothetical protein